MIDLKVKNGVPNAISIAGYVYLLNTDFRLWMDFPERMKDFFEGKTERYTDLFAGDPAPITEEAIEQINAFYFQKPVVPRGSSDGEEVLSFDIDSGYIYAAFLQAYGVDLTECDMHWHKFQALLTALPEDTMLVRITSSRQYKGSEKELRELRHMWELPAEYTKEEKEAVEEFNEIFG